MSLFMMLVININGAVIIGKKPITHWKIIPSGLKKAFGIETMMLAVKFAMIYCNGEAFCRKTKKKLRDKPILSII